jgi:hypothetical protein
LNLYRIFPPLRAAAGSDDVLTWIEMAGSAIVAFLYIAILASAMTAKTRKKAPPPVEQISTEAKASRPYAAYDRA